MPLSKLDKQKILVLLKSWGIDFQDFSLEKNQDLMQHVTELAQDGVLSSDARSALATIALEQPKIAKDFLQNMADSQIFIKKMTPDSAYYLGQQYYQMLRVQMSGVQQNPEKIVMDDMHTVVRLLQKMQYPQHVYVTAFRQAKIINIAANVLQFDGGINVHSWNNVAPEEREQYLNKISLVSDHAMHVMGSHPALYAPDHVSVSAPDHVVLLRPDKTDHGFYGLYHDELDVIYLNQEMDYVQTIRTLQHEKTHQWIYKEGIAKAVSNNDRKILELTDLQNNVLQMFCTQFGAKHSDPVYFARPDELLAFATENFKPATMANIAEQREDSAQLRKIIEHRPKGVEFMLQAMDMYDVYLDAQSWINDNDKGLGFKGLDLNRPD